MGCRATRPHRAPAARPLAPSAGLASCSRFDAPGSVIIRLFIVNALTSPSVCVQSGCSVSMFREVLLFFLS